MDKNKIESYMLDKESIAQFSVHSANKEAYTVKKDDFDLWMQNINESKDILFLVINYNDGSLAVVHKKKGHSKVTHYADSLVSIVY